MLRILVSCKLEKSYVAAKISERVVSLSISETEFEIWDTWKAPSGLVFIRELRGDPELEDLGLALKLVVVLTVVIR